MRIEENTGHSRLSRLLLATDFSAISRYALRYAARIAHETGATLFVAHVLHPGNNHTELNGIAPRDEVSLQAEQEIRRFLQTADLEGISPIPVVEEGLLGEALERLANRYQIDLVVAGTRGLREHTVPRLGSGAEQIFRYATHPVLTIGPQVVAAGSPASVPQHILVATDFAASSERAAAYALALAQRVAARTTFLHVEAGNVPCVPAAHLHARQISMQRMQHQVQAMHEKLSDIEFQVRFGSATAEILSAAREIQADLIVLGAKSSESWAHGVPLSTVYNIVIRASCPVLTVRS